MSDVKQAVLVFLIAMTGITSVLYFGTFTYWMGLVCVYGEITLRADRLLPFEVPIMALATLGVLIGSVYWTWKLLRGSK